MSYLGIGLETTSITDVDFSELPEAACDYPVECSKSVEWMLFLPCGCKHILCEPHKEIECRTFEEWLAVLSLVAFTCYTCKKSCVFTEPLSAERI